jgi:hypothetical protein
MYRLLKVLGIGGMGVVFLAEDPQLKRLLALKALKPTLAASPGARQRFLREARAAAAIDHEHVISIYQVGEANGIPFLAMPLLKGESLEERLRREGRLPLPEVLRIGREMAEGLEAAHASGLVHRDVKPSNVWLEAPPHPYAAPPNTGERRRGEGGRVKILDFGLARGKGDAPLTQPGAVLGTPAYMAPEQADHKAVTLRCDLYSLGCVLYRMSTGQAPFKGRDLMNVLKQVLLETPRPIHELNPEVPPELSRLVADLMAKDPAARPARARLVADALGALEQTARSPVVVAKGPATTDPATPARPSRAGRSDEAPVLSEPARARRSGRWARGLPWWGWALAGGALLVLAAVIAVVTAKHLGRQTPADRTAPPASEALRPPEADVPPGWQAFSPPGGRFTVLLPGDPKETKSVSQTERGAIETHTFAIEAGANTYAVSWFDFPGVVPQGPQIKGALEGGKNGLLEKLGRIKVLKDEEITFDGFPGKEVVVENREKRYTLTVRLYLVRQRTYTLMASAPLGQSDAADVQRFFASFRLLP